MYGGIYPWFLVSNFHHHFASTSKERLCRSQTYLTLLARENVGVRRGMSFSKSARATAVAGLTAADGVRRVAKNEEGSNMDAALSAGVERTLMVLAGILHSQRAGITPLFLVPPPR